MEWCGAATMHAFCTQEWAWSDVYSTNFPVASDRVHPEATMVATWRFLAASMATSTASLAVPWMTPPPFPPGQPKADSGRHTPHYCICFPEFGPDFTEWKPGGRAMASANQSSTTVSSSVAAGLLIQLNPITLKAPLSMSPSRPAVLLLAGK